MAQANEAGMQALPSPTPADWAVAKWLVDAEDRGFHAPAAGWRFHRLPTACVDSCLGLVGLVDPTSRRPGRRLALGLSTVLAAVLTPPDVFSLLLLLVPLYLLYELSIILLVLLPSGRVAQGMRCVLAHVA